MIWGWSGSLADRDDVIDIFDVVFGDMQRAATNRGKKRRAGELKDYDRAVGELHARMQSVLDALDDDEAITVVLTALREEREGVVEAMGTVTALMRPPADPYHERLVACDRQIRRFLPMLIEALAMESTAPARPVLEAFGALGTWLAERPHTARLPGADVPLDVVSGTYRPGAGGRPGGGRGRSRRRRPG